MTKGLRSIASGRYGPVLNVGADRGWFQMSMGCKLVPVGGEMEL